MKSSAMVNAQQCNG